MGRIERNGTCGHCDGRVRYYPPAGLVAEGVVATTGYWAHLDTDWLKDPHSPSPTPASLAAAGLPG